MSREGPVSGDGRLADVESLRRIERTAAVWAAAAAIVYGALVSWPGALALTAVAGASIVAFRGLQRIVSALGPQEISPAGRPETTETTDPAGTQDRRSRFGAPGIGVLVRLAFLGAVVAAGAFLLEPEHLPAFVLGFSTLPAALVTEGLRQAVRAFRGRRDHHDGS